MSVPAVTAPPRTPDRPSDPEGRRDRQVAGLSLLVSAVLSVAGGIGLAVAFGWPAVLGEPATVALPAFAASEVAVRAWFVVLLWSSVLLVPGVLALHRLVAGHLGGSALLGSASAFGLAGAVLQTLGWVRWPLVVPALADAYLDPAASPTARDATAATYDLLNRYAGAALGEHLGWLFQGLWAVGLSLFLIRLPSVAPAWLRRSLPVVAIAWGLTLVPAGWLGSDALAQAGTGLYSVWYLWLAVLGGYLLAGRRTA